MDEEKKAKYGTSEHGNFYVRDTIGVPHPYCITPRHVGWASDHWGGLLSEDAIRDSEKHGARCDICKGDLTYDQHEQALLVACKIEMVDADKKAVPELHTWLLGIKDMATADGYAGFAFMKV